MDFIKSIAIAASGLRAQSGRMRLVAENIANAESTAQTPDGEPYRRKIPTFKAAFDRELRASVVELGPVSEDQADFKLRFEPGHPAANADGYVQLPNVNTLIEMMDMREAQRSYQANLNVITASRRMIGQTVDILRA